MILEAEKLVLEVLQMVVDQDGKFADEVDQETEWLMEAWEPSMMSNVAAVGQIFREDTF